MIEKIEKFLQELISGKIKTKLDLHEPDMFEDSESFTEEILIPISDEYSFSCDFEWGYTRKKGMKSDGYLTPDDPDTLILDYFDIKKLSFYDNEEEIDITMNRQLCSSMKKYLIEEIGLDEVPRIYEKDWNHIFGTVNNPMYENKRLMKFEQFVNEGKVEKKGITAE